MSKKKTAKKVTRDMIYRSVASSTAIETGGSVRTIEKKLKSNRSRFRSLTLAD